MKDKSGNELQSVELILGEYQKHPCFILSGKEEDGKKVVRIISFQDIRTVPADEVSVIGK